MHFVDSFPDHIPNSGTGEDEAFELIDHLVKEHSASLGAPEALAHMDPAPAKIAARLVGLNAQLNQNLLHPDLSPFATEAERKALDWLLPFFGMKTGHMCSGSTIANLEALWCAREHGVTQVVASRDAHISIPKAARILGMTVFPIEVTAAGRIDPDRLPDLSSSALVLTAGTTGRGVIDSLGLGRDAAWLHIDAAWAGPLRMTCYKDRLAGIDAAHSISISAHKWLFQPKDSALVLFRDSKMTEAVSFGSSYLTVPNVGVQGSRGAAGIALLGTLLAWGRAGLASKIESLISMSEDLAERIELDPRCELLQPPETGVINWRPVTGNTNDLVLRLGSSASSTTINGEVFIRHVAANMHADIEAVWAKIEESLE